MALVQTAQNAYNLGTVQNLTLGSAATTGNTMIIAWACGFGIGTTPAFSVTDTAGNTYHQIANQNYETGTGPFSPAGELLLYAAYNITGGFTTITFTNSGIAGGASAIIIAREYSALATTPLDGTPVTNIQTVTSTSTSGNLTTTKAADLLVGFQLVTNATGASTVGTGYGNFTSESSVLVGTQFLMMEDQNVTSVGTYAATFNLAGISNAFTGLAAFSNASQPTGNNHFLSLMGCGT